MNLIKRLLDTGRGRLLVIGATLPTALGLAIYGVDSDLVNFFYRLARWS